ncbi:MAG: hypothetical protein AB7F43_10255 [Bacteriovoracia bacterium]
MNKHEFKFNTFTGSILLGIVFLFSVLSTTACSPEFNKIAKSKARSIASVEEVIPPTPVQLLDGAAQSGMASVNSSASFKMSKVSVGGSYQRDISSGTNYKVGGALNYGL